MEERLKYEELAPKGLETLVRIENYLYECGLDEQLIELVKTRASQINGRNRHAIAFRKVPEIYRSPNYKAMNPSLITLSHGTKKSLILR